MKRARRCRGQASDLFCHRWVFKAQRTGSQSLQATIDGTAFRPSLWSWNPLSPHDSFTTQWLSSCPLQPKPPQYFCTKKLGHRGRACRPCKPVFLLSIRPRIARIMHGRGYISAKEVLNKQTQRICNFASGEEPNVSVWFFTTEWYWFLDRGRGACLSFATHGVKQSIWNGTLGFVGQYMSLKLTALWTVP